MIINKDRRKPVKDSFQAFLVEEAYFTRDEEYPIIPKDFVSQDRPLDIKPFSKAFASKEDLSQTWICFYEADGNFERVRRDPRRYLPFLRRTAGIIGLDYSIHSDMPFIKQKAQMNDNLSLTYFFAQNGIPIIPNIRIGVEELEDEFLEAIPKGCLIAIGTHGFILTRQEKCYWYSFINRIAEKLSPSGIIVYGALSGKRFDNLKAKYSFHFYPPWLYTCDKRKVKHGN